MLTGLPERLHCIAEAIPPGSRVIDVGTDHALLPVYLVEHHRVSFAIASDVARGPCAAARENVMRHGLGQQISIRMGDGLSTVHPGEVDTVVIAGMGGQTAVDILSAAPDVLRDVRSIVVQPMNGAHRIRSFLLHHGYGIEHEWLLEEAGRTYEVIASSSQVSPKAGYGPYLDDDDELYVALDLGPIILGQKSPIVVRHVKRVRSRWEEILVQLGRSHTETSDDKRRLVLRRIAVLDAWLINAAEQE